MENVLRNRLQERLSALKINPFEAARRAGFERSMINDLLIGKKKTIRQGKLEAIADALDCDPEYLAGFQPRPRRREELDGTASEGLPLRGVCEADAWREAGGLAQELISINPDPRYPADRQSAYLVRGDHAAGLGIDDGAILCVVEVSAVEDIRDGDIVLASRSRAGVVELTARKVSIGRSGVLLLARPGHGSIDQLREGDDAKIEGIILRAVRVFGELS